MRLIVGLSLTILLSTSVSHAQDSGREVPDIILASRLDLSWSEMLISKLRRYVMNMNLGDPLGARVEQDIEIGEIRANDVLAPSSRRLVADIGSMMGLKLIDAHSKIVIKNIEYKLDKVTTDLMPINRDSDGQVFDGLFAAKGVQIFADSIKLIMEIPTAGRRRLPLVEVTINRPFIRSSPRLAIVAKAQVKVLEEARELSFKILNSSFESLAEIMRKNPNDFELGYESIDIPQVSISIGSRRMNIDPDKVRAAIAAREELLKDLLIEQLRGQLKSGIAQKALDLVQTVKIPNEYWITVDKMQMKLKVARIAGSQGSKNVILRVQSDFCTLVSFDQNQEECLNKKTTQPAASVTTPEKLRKSIEEVRGTLTRGDANMVASISEDYINKLVSTTVDAGYFDQKMLEAGASFGPTKTFVRLNERGDTGTLYIDLKYKITGLQSVLVGGNEIRFPLVFKCTMRIEKGPAGYPLVIFKIKEAVMDNKTLRKGFPLMGLPSTVEKLKRFESKVVKKIREEVKPMIGQDIISLELPLFKDVGLESLEFISDGYGRMSANANLENALFTRPTSAL